MEPIHECLSDAPCTIICTSHRSSEEEPPSPVNLILNLNVQSQQILGNLDPVVVGIRDVVHCCAALVHRVTRTYRSAWTPASPCSCSLLGYATANFCSLSNCGVGGSESDGRRRTSPQFVSNQKLVEYPRRELL